ncbi:hypothetical protein HDU97_001863 [Phlyctochytrium planicorne]|nr:hypothetical protein HDU97_001863 [Phlyctochytrium planicorne]
MAEGKDEVMGGDQPGKPAAPQFNDFEDDDEFEDFGLNEWDATQEDTSDADLWVEDWDAEDMNDEFTIQLRAELERPAPPPPQQQPNNNDSNNNTMQE